MRFLYHELALHPGQIGQLNHLGAVLTGRYGATRKAQRSRSARRYKCSLCAGKLRQSFAHLVLQFMDHHEVSRCLFHRLHNFWRYECSAQRREGSNGVDESADAEPGINVRRSWGGGGWGQTDLPVDATAVFPPNHVPSGSPPSNYTGATVHYMDPEGHQVNVASSSPPGITGASIVTTETDMKGNTINRIRFKVGIINTVDKFLNPVFIYKIVVGFAELFINKFGDLVRWKAKQFSQ